MASSIHIKKATAGILLHNNRENFSHSVVFADEKNEILNTSKEAFNIYRQELKVRSEAYTKRTKQTLQKSAVTHLSAVVNLEKHHTLKDLQLISKEIEKKFDTKTIQMSIHRDEGKLISKDGLVLVSGVDFFKNTKDDLLYRDKQFINKINLQEYQIEKNYHGHIEFMGLDSTGGAIRQKMNKFVLSQLQTFVAEKLEMQRGINYQEQGIKAPKRLDVLEFKREATKNNKTKITVAEIKKKFEVERQELIARGDVPKDDYEALRKLQSKALEDLKNKDLDINSLNEKIEEFKRTLTYKESLKNKYFQDYVSEEYKSKAKDLTIEKLKEDKDYITDNFKSTVDVLNDDINNLKKELELAKNKASGSLGLNSNLNEKVTDLENKLIEARKTIKELQEENVSLKDEITALNDIKSYFNNKKWFANNNLEVNAENIQKFNLAVDKYNKDMSNRVKELKEENVSLRDEIMSLKLSKAPEKIEEDFHEKFQRGYALENAKKAQEIIKEKRELTPAEKVDRFEAIVAKRKEEQEQGLSM